MVDRIKMVLKLVYHYFDSRGKHTTTVWRTTMTHKQTTTTTEKKKTNYTFNANAKVYFSECARECFFYCYYFLFFGWFIGMRAWYSTEHNNRLGCRQTITNTHTHTHTYIRLLNERERVGKSVRRSFPFIKQNGNDSSAQAFN